MWVVRVAVLAAVLVHGVGLVAYVVAWVAVPRRGEDDGLAVRVWRDRRERHATVATTAVATVLVLVLAALGHGLGVAAVWPLLPTVIGAIVVWRGASTEERRALSASLTAPVVRVGRSSGWRATAVRVGLGVAAVVAGLNLLVASRTAASPVTDLLGGLVVTGAGLLVLFTPWWSETVRELAEERLARSRAQARADVADHLHDSVLQMLALIQKAADDPVEVTRLARKTERDLRSWLFGDERAARDSVAARVRAIESDVEADYAVRVETVLVGDAPVTEAHEALVLAAREAVVNAAKWSGAPVVSVFAEIAPGEMSLYVRDRGRGFDPDAVGDDHHGVAHSIVERVARAGGVARVTSRPGEGTEVELQWRTVP